MVPSDRSLPQEHLLAGQSAYLQRRGTWEMQSLW